VSTIADYPQCVADRLADLDRERDQILGTIPAVILAESIAAMFPERTTMVSLPNAGRVCHYIHIRESMDEAVAVIREYRKKGIQVDGFHDHGNARIYKLSRNIDLYVSIPVSEGAKCRYVQVGTKEVPVMELRCDGKPVASAEATP
jgi:hypothetical protein